MKFGNLNFLEPSGPLQACNGTDLLLHENWNKRHKGSNFKWHNIYSESEDKTDVVGVYKEWPVGLKYSEL